MYPTALYAVVTCQNLYKLVRHQIWCKSRLLNPVALNLLFPMLPSVRTAMDILSMRTSIKV